MFTRKSQNRPLVLTAYRWLDILVLAMLAASTCAFFHPQLSVLATKLAEQIMPWPPLIRALIALLLSSFLWYAVVWLGGFRFRDLLPGNLIYNPPPWLASFLGGTLYWISVRFYFETLAWHDVSRALGAWDVLIVIGGLIIARFAYSAQHSEEIPGGTASLLNVKTAERSDAKEISLRMQDWLQEERPIVAPAQDLLSHDVIARRIARLLRESPLKTIGFVGPYGSGKSSILEMVRWYLSHSRDMEPTFPDGNRISFDPHKILICRIEAWGLEKGRPAEHVLNIAIQHLAKYTDCLGLVGLPSSYTSAVSGLPSPWLRFFVNLVGASEGPMSLLARVDRTLVRRRMRLVVFLEDLDRNDDFGTLSSEIAALLDRLKYLQNVSFVLTLTQENLVDPILLRICEHSETIPYLTRTNAISLLSEFHNTCLEKFPDDVNLFSTKEMRERLGFAESPFQDLFADKRNAPLEWIVRLLTTPRSMKLVFRRTWDTWRMMHGELDFNDLLITNVLRGAAPEAFAFVHANVRNLRNLRSERERPSGKDPDPANLMKIWQGMTENVDWDNEAGLNLVNTIFPGLVTGMSKFSTVPQGVSFYEPDYWQRLNAEEIPPGHLRDQSVLKRIRDWKEHHAHDNKASGNLAKDILRVDGLAERVERPGGALLVSREVRQLAEEFFAIFLENTTTRGARKEPPGFIELWRLSLDKPDQDHENWIEKQIKIALEKDLRFANDLYYYWRSDQRSGATHAPPTPQLRQRVIEASKRIFVGNPKTLVAVIDPDYIYSTYHFVVYYREPSQGGQGFKPSEWIWFAQVMLDAAKLSPDVIVPQIAGLLVDRHSVTGAGYRFEFKLEIAQELFGTKIRQLMTILAAELNTSRFDKTEKDWIEFARSYAQKWISQNPKATPKSSRKSKPDE